MNKHKRSSIDGPNPKRKSGWARKKEANERNLKHIIAQDKKQLKLNFIQSGQSNSRLVAIDVNDKGLNDDLKHMESTNMDIKIQPFSTLIVSSTSKNTRKENCTITQSKTPFISIRNYDAESLSDFKSQEFMDDTNGQTTNNLDLNEASQ
jgi:hypothetical protein